MNATQWETLTEFIKWLGREGKCVVDETEKGWFVAYIDRDPAAVAAQEAKAKKAKMDKDDQVNTYIGTQALYPKGWQRHLDDFSSLSS
jgi:DNA/RNA-binding protein KIN17